MTHDELLQRLESGGGADRELDCLIAEALGLAPDGYTRSPGGTVFDAPPLGDDPRSPGFRYADPYTASIDATTALADRLHGRARAQAMLYLAMVEAENDLTAPLGEAVARALCLECVRGKMERPAGIEPATDGLKGRRSTN